MWIHTYTYTNACNKKRTFHQKSHEPHKIIMFTRLDDFYILLAYFSLQFSACFWSMSLLGMSRQRQRAKQCADPHAVESWGFLWQRTQPRSGNFPPSHTVPTMFRSQSLSGCYRQDSISVITPSSTAWVQLAKRPSKRSGDHGYCWPLLGKHSLCGASWSRYWHCPSLIDKEAKASVLTK